jgi:hypothetical protein
MIVSGLRKLSFHAVLALIAMAMAAPSWGAAQYCQGTITGSWVSSDGYFYVAPSWRGDSLRLCNVLVPVTANTLTVEVTTCMAWMAHIRQAMAAGKNTIMYYADSPACAVMPTYLGAPLPNYVMVLNY